MPQLGETVTEGTITRWFKAIGDTVSRDEPLFEVSTDKVDSEVPSPAAGVLSEILVPEGETVEVGARLAVIGDSVAAAGEAPPAPSGAVPSAPDQAKVEPTPPAPASSTEPSNATPPPPPDGFTPQSGSTASEAHLEQVDVDGRILSPVVRRLLTENAIDPASIVGSGIGGRITREDVLAVIDARNAASARAGGYREDEPLPPFQHVVGSAQLQTYDQAYDHAYNQAHSHGYAPAPSVAAAPTAVGAPTSQPGSSAGSPAELRTPTGDVVVPFSNMRRRTAEHMVRSKSTSPHAYISYEVDFENVERVRSAWGERFRAEEGYSLTYLPFVARAVVESLREFPFLNASVGEDSLIVHNRINLGIAVDLDHQGLIVPVVHRAEEVTLRGVARRIHDVADRARTRQLTADDISGGTFSITNDGPFGAHFTVPIINQPQVAILATDGISRRPVVVTHDDGAESIAIHSVGLLGMSWDHRAVDGAYVASFLRRMSDFLGRHDWSGEL
jgi:2-oxoglutarate dehydrogenase E2 component (dihydrolipoamide succinyltransferase)